VLEGWEQCVFALLILYPAVSSPVSPVGYTISVSFFCAVNGVIAWLDQRDIMFKEASHPLSQGKDYRLGQKSDIMTNRTCVWILFILSGLCVCVLLFAAIASPLRISTVHMQLVSEQNSNNVYEVNITNTGAALTGVQQLVFTTYNTVAIWKRSVPLESDTALSLMLECNMFFPPIISVDYLVNDVSVIDQLLIFIVNAYQQDVWDNSGTQQ